MEGKRPYLSPSKEHRKAIAFAPKHREYNQAEAMSKRVAFTVYVYDLLPYGAGKLINTFNSILRLKKAYNITMHHKTLYKHIAAPDTKWRREELYLITINFHKLL